MSDAVSHVCGDGFQQAVAAGHRVGEVNKAKELLDEGNGPKELF